MPIDGRLVIRQGKIRGRVLVVGQRLIGVGQLHAAAHLITATMPMLIAMCKGGWEKAQDRSTRNKWQKRGCKRLHGDSFHSTPRLG